MKAKLQGDLKTAMKAGEKLRLMTVRGILAEVTRLEKDVCREANDDEIVQIIKRERARRDESLEFARRGKRYYDLITQYEAEAKILEGYLPDAVGEAELSTAVTAHIAAGVKSDRADHEGAAGSIWSAAGRQDGECGGEDGAGAEVVSGRFVNPCV